MGALSPRLHTRKRVAVHGVAAARRVCGVFRRQGLDCGWPVCPGGKASGGGPPGAGSCVLATASPPWPLVVTNT